MTQSEEDYLEAIYELSIDGVGVCVRDVAQRLNVKMPSVVRAVSNLKKRGLVTQVPHSKIEMTEKGQRLANLVSKRHSLLRSFLIKLGVTSTTADKEACLMEHILSVETLEQIRKYTEKT